MSISLRPAVLIDLIWLEPFYEELMRPYVELTHTWDSSKFRKLLALQHTKIIQFDSQDVGMLKVERCHDYIYLGDIQIKTEFQRRGIGSQLIRDLIQEAQSQLLPMRLRVLKGNPAIKLYQRLGFTEIQALEYHYLMEYQIE